MVNWYPSEQIWKTCSTNQIDSMCVYADSLRWHANTYPLLFAVPTYDYSNMSMGLPMLGQNMDLLNPFLAMWQVQMKNDNNNFWNIGNLPGMPGVDNSNNDWWNINKPGKQNNNDKTPTANADEEKYKNRFNKLLSFAKGLVNYKKLDEDELSALTTAIRNSGNLTANTAKDKTKLYEEKYNTLFEAIKDIDKATIKAYLSTAPTEGVDGKTLKGLYYEELLKAGYEYDSQIDDSAILNLKEAISKLKDSSNQESNDILGSVELGNGEYTILNVLSSWNSSSETNKMTIIKYIEKTVKTDKIKIDDTLVTKNIKPFVTALDDVTGALIRTIDDAELKKALKDAKSAMDKEYNNLFDLAKKDKAKNFGSLAEKFDKLYVLTRLAAAKQLGKEAQKDYAFINEEVFNENIFVDETIEDLKSEGLEKYITGNVKEVIDVDNAPSGVNNDDKVDDNDGVDNVSNNEKAEKQNKAKDIAQTLMSALANHTDKDDWDTIVSTINDEINKDNVVDVIKAFNDHNTAKTWNQGFFAYILSEWGYKEEKTDCAKKMLGYIIDHAKDLEPKITDSEDKKYFKVYMTSLEKYAVNLDKGAYIDNIVKALFSILDKVS